MISVALFLSLIACLNFALAQEAPRPEGSTPIKPPMIKPPMQRSRNANSGGVKSSRRRRTVRRKRVVRSRVVKTPNAEQLPALSMPEQEEYPGTGGGSPASIKPPMANNEGRAPLVTATQQGKTVAGGILNGKAISLPHPPYPAIARSARAAGMVVVQVIIDERGDIMSAHAVSGHPLLQSAAVRAAREAKFAPTRIEGQPVKVSGKITYNFVL